MLSRFKAGSATAWGTILCSIFVMLLHGCGSLEARRQVLAHIHQQFIRERSMLQSALELARAKSSDIWAKGDIIFYSFWLDGSDQEQKGQYDAAITLYRKALNTPRYEMESYEVLLALGRALFLSGKTSEARSQLKEFIKNSEDELNGEENPMWAPSDETKEAIKKNIIFAKWLMEQKL